MTRPRVIVALMLLVALALFVLLLLLLVPEPLPHNGPVIEPPPMPPTYEGPVIAS